MLPFFIKALHSIYDPSARKRGKEVFSLKPTMSKILVLWPIMILLVILFDLLFFGKKFFQFDLLPLLAGGAWLLVATFLFCTIFFHLPYYAIEITDGHLIGPSLWGINWHRVFIPIDEIDIRATNTSLHWLGFYVIKSRQGDKILIWGFDLNQFEKLLMALNQEKCNKMDAVKD
jgi:hypothetical protein